MTKSPVQNTELSKRLKKIFKQGERRKANERQAAKKAKKSQPEQANPGGPHVDANAPLRGVLGKGDNYARRGYTYLKDQDGRGVYRNFSFPHLDQIRSMVRDLAEFPEGPKRNFNPTYTQQLPYPWQAHHLLPGSAFYYEIKGKPVFTFQQLRLILQTDYNINHGHNLILLPEQTWACPVHTLVSHLGDHESYTIMVMNSLSKRAKEIQEKIDQGSPHESMKIDLFDMLRKLEDQVWRVVVAISREAIPLACIGVKYTDDLLNWEMDGVSFEFPILG